MLKSLFIQNYAIIQDLQIDFNGGLSTITGETGAGKSILLGALSLLIGNRADSNVLFDDSRKCIVEGIFQIGGYGLEDFFKENDIDFVEQTVVRREINPDGKSRAFVNDSPVNLSLLKVMGEQLIDIHSQHENLYIENPVFQLRILDTFAKQLPTLQLFSEKFRNYKNLLSEYQDEKDKAEKNKADLDYFQFQYNQLSEAKLKEGEQEELEEELKLLTHAEEIKSHLAQVLGLLSGDEISVIAMLKDALSNLSRIQAVFSAAESYGNRIDASFIELKDIAKEIETNYEKIDFDPERAELVRQRIDLIYSLQQKHRVSSVDELIHIQDDLKNRIDHITNSDEKLNNLKKAIDIEKSVLENISGELSRNRKNVIPQIEARVQELLFQLGMPNAVFKVEIISGDEFNSYGSDKVRFLFSANKQSFPLELSKVASGGEMARLMLSIKVVISEALILPTIIFDEIDQGVSGEIADKMGNMIFQMAQNTQIINITHLPQIASKGRNHYLVYKKDMADRSQTHIKQLKADERVIEIARMLSGEKLSDAAINNAKALLGMN